MKKLFLILLFLSFEEVFAQGGGYYQMICRGPFSSKIFNNWVSIKINRGLGPAGPRGGNLMPGYCAFLDRGIGSNEPDTIEFNRDFESGPSNDPDVQYRNILNSIEHGVELTSLLLAIRNPNEYFKILVTNVPSSSSHPGSYFRAGLTFAEFWQ